jgi:hypothetical protein
VVSTLMELLVEIDNLPNHEFMEGHDFDRLFGLLVRACEKNLLAASNGLWALRPAKSSNKNPADGEPHAGFQTTQALPVHPWSRRYGYRRRGSGGFQIIR